MSVPWLISQVRRGTRISLSGWVVMAKPALRG